MADDLTRLHAAAKRLRARGPYVAPEDQKVSPEQMAELEAFLAERRTLIDERLEALADGLLVPEPDPSPLGQFLDERRDAIVSAQRVVRLARAEVAGRLPRGDGTGDRTDDQDEGG